MNTYIDLNEFDEIIHRLYTDKELEAVGVDSYSDKDLDIYINRVIAKLDRLHYKGTFQEPYQESAFPRVIRGVNIGVPKEIKEFTAYLTVKELPTYKLDEREKLQRAGVKSIKVEGASETYVDNKSILKYGDLDEKEVDKYLSKYLY